jgi:hypothetical protein
VRRICDGRGGILASTVVVDVATECSNCDFAEEQTELVLVRPERDPSRKSQSDATSAKKATERMQGRNNALIQTPQDDFVYLARRGSMSGTLWVFSLACGASIVATSCSAFRRLIGRRVGAQTRRSKVPSKSWRDHLRHLNGRCRIRLCLNI